MMTDRQRLMMEKLGLKEKDFQPSDVNGDAIAELADIIAVQDDAIAELAEIIGEIANG